MVKETGKKERGMVVKQDENGVPALVIEHGSTLFRVGLFFSIRNRETLEDKIKRLIRNDLQKEH